MLLEKDGGKIAVNPDRFDKLITALRTAVDNDGKLDKEATSYNDIFDAFSLALKFYHFEQKKGSILVIGDSSCCCYLSQYIWHRKLFYSTIL
jgi:hypothetical protein